MPFNRKDEILATLSRQGEIDVETLARDFGVAPQTVRRDLTALVDAGLVARTHGGARLAAAVGASSYDARRLRNLPAKAAIAKMAAALVPDGASVALNIGTTTEQVARALLRHKDLTVISNNTHIIQILQTGALQSLVMIGGEVRPEDGAIVGPEAVASLANYKVDLAIIGASALDADGSALDFDLREVAVARAILSNARETVLVADATKFDVRAPHRICSISQLSYVVLDQAPPEPFRALAEQSGTRLILSMEPKDV